MKINFLIIIILTLFSCSNNDFDERLSGTWESNKATVIINENRTMKLLSKENNEFGQGEIFTEGGYIFLLKPRIFWFVPGDVKTFLKYEIQNSDSIIIENQLFIKFKHIKPLKPKPGAKPIRVK